MRFPNAFKGVSKLFAAEILKLIAAGLIVAGGIATLFGSAGVIYEVSEGAELTEQLVAANISPVPVVVGFALVGAAMILFIIAYIMNLVGLGQASRDEENFRNAFIVSIIVLIISVATAIITGTNVAAGMGGNISQLARTIAEIIVMVSVIMGVQNLARYLGDSGEEVLGNRIITTIMVSLIVSAAASFISIFFNNSVMYTIDGILGIISGIAMIVAYISYIVFLGRAKRILREGQ